ncbi:hypothetical protein IAT38_005753 [Cryptococcus sp. DSM 104549]
MSRQQTPRLFSQALSALRGSPSTSSSARSFASSASSSSSYPFNPSAIVRPATTPSPPPPNLLHPKRGWSLITHLNASAPVSPYAPLFARRSPDRLATGSIVTVFTYTDATRTTTAPFSGILMGVRRGSSGAVDTAFRLRNIVARTGVEMTFKLSSPMIKEIRVLQRAGEGGKGGIKDLRRAKVNYLRERPAVMAGIAKALKAAKQQAAKEAEEAAKQDQAVKPTGVAA